VHQTTKKEPKNTPVNGNKNEQLKLNQTKLN